MQKWLVSVGAAPLIVMSVGLMGCEALRVQELPVVWEKDSRQEVRATDKDYSLAQATALLMHKQRLTPVVGEALFKVPENPLGMKYPLCPEERFLDQNILGHCSGVLIGPRTVLTAGHCVSEQKYCDDIYITFGRTQEKAESQVLSAQEIYSCKRIIRSENTPKADYGLIELDRDVIGVTPVALASRTDLKEGMAIKSYSYPLGLPLKKDLSTVGSRGPNEKYLFAKVDTFSGSSGSPLYNLKNELIGILVTGSEDFDVSYDEISEHVSRGGCISSHLCKGNDCNGERYFKVDAMDLSN